MVVPSPSAQSTKAALRQALRRDRRDHAAALTMGERRGLERRLADHLAALVQQHRCIAGYASLGSEIDPAMVLGDASRAGRQIAYPAIAEPGAPMLFRIGPCTAASPWGGLQPPPTAHSVTPDLVLVPLVAIDRHGTRIGQGGGHYDRALPALCAAGSMLIGVGWAIQRVDHALPADPWDVALDGFGSPDGLEMFR